MTQAPRYWLALLFLVSSACRANAELSFSQLPNEVQKEIKEVQAACKEFDEDRIFVDMSGVHILDILGNGARDIFLDNERICGNAMAGANCSNRGCDLKIYKEVGRDHWIKIFDDHLYDKHISIDWTRMRFQQMVISIYAADPRCNPNPRTNYTSGMSCNLTVKYRNNQWIYQRIK